ncbi:MAG: response regulator [Polyangiales bacterium]
MSRVPITEVLVIAPVRLVPHVRIAFDGLEPSVQRTTELTRATHPLTAQILRARCSMPPCGVVVVIAAGDDPEAPLALGADEVVEGAFDTPVLARAIRRAAMRASVREDRAAEARTLEQVIAGLSDSLDAPLAALALDLDSLRIEDEGRPADEVAALDDCATAIERMTHLVRDLRLLAPCVGERGVFEPVALPVLVDQVLRVLGGALARRAHIERDDEENLPEVLAPRKLLARTIAHVLVQALDAVIDENDDAPGSSRTGTVTPELQALSRLRIALRSDAQSIAIVIDARPGLETGHFSTATALEGVGRLAIAREVLRSFDGELVGERSPDGGVRYVLFVPRPQPGISSFAPRVSSAIAAARLRRPRVLIVDADERVLRAAARAVAEHYDAIVATAGEEALACVSEGGIDAIVVDQRLPDMTAALFVDELRRSHPALAGRVVVVVRTREEARHARTAQVPEVQILERPIRRTALLAALLGAIGSPTPAVARPLNELN